MSTQIALQSYQFQSHSLRVIPDENGEPWFIAKDVCDILGYKSARQAIEDNCRKSGVSVRYIPELSNRYTLINEGNLYRLVVKSNKPEAEPFESWVCDEVLPAIRKTGSYSVNRPPEPQFSIPKTLSEALLLAGKLAEENEAALAKIEADKPKVEFAEAVRNLDGTCSVEQLAKVLGFGRNKFYDALREAGYLMKGNQPYQLYIKQGLFTYEEGKPWFDSKGRSYPTFETRITGKGQVAIEKFFRK